MVLPWIASLLDPTFAHTGNFTIGLMLTTFVSGALLLSGYTSRRNRANGIELLLIMVLYWTLLPAIAAIPFIGASQIDSLEEVIQFQRDLKDKIRQEEYRIGEC